MSPAAVPSMNAADLAQLNSATQYPSILTYHAMGERGRLTEDRTADFTSVDPDDVEVTEKVDGTNARIIIPPNGFGNAVIGSRTELLHYADDVIANPTLAIVDTVKPFLVDMFALRGVAVWTVVYGEVYGGRVSSGSKNYTTQPDQTGFRIFDVATIPPDVLDWDRAGIATWRDGGGQDFIRSDVLAHAADELGLDLVPLLLDAGVPPTSVVDTHEWLAKAISTTCCGLDITGKGRPEGVVVRTADRSQIAKVRFEDYERTARKKPTP